MTVTPAELHFDGNTVSSDGNIYPAVERGRRVRIYFELSVSSTPVDLTGYSARCQIKGARGLEEPALLTLTVGDGITLTEVDGAVEVVITDEQAAELTAGTKYYDVVLIDPSGNADCYLKGRIKFLESVTSSS